MQNSKKQLTKKQQEQQKQKFIEELVSEVENDFINRQNQRRSLESQWELNLNFLVGNQYAKINKRGEIDEVDNEFFWQERQVFNHIAPIIETRLAKFSRIKHVACIRPFSDDDRDIIGANNAEKLIEYALKDNQIDEVIKKVTVWSEACGTAFYKVVWNNYGGEVIGNVDGKKVYEGSVEILPISPFEIFPDSLYNQELADCQSIIHARAMSVSEVFNKYGVRVVGNSVDVFGLDNASGVNGSNSIKGCLNDATIVIEKYQKPSPEFPNGRLITVAGGKLLYYGELPYLNGKDKRRDFPFVKQESVYKPGSFFGVSIIERLIPVQRAYNAVKNRKHEFLNRLSMGVLSVEDGSIDVDDLADGGLSPGKILVYRQGFKEPKIMNEITMPSEFSDEEEKLLKEFVIISGVSDVSSSEKNASLSGASALKLLIEQDNERMIIFAEKIRKSFVEMSKQIIRLFAQFMKGVKAIKSIDGLNKTKIIYADDFALRSDDVYLENDNEMLESLEERKQTIYKLYDSGILTNSSGNVDDDVKTKILSILGYRDLDNRKGIHRLHAEQAQKENDKLRKGDIFIEQFDDDNIHVFEHTRYVLGEYDELSKEQKERFNKHIKEHKNRLENAQKQIN